MRNCLSLLFSSLFASLVGCYTLSPLPPMDDDDSATDDDDDTFGDDDDSSSDDDDSSADDDDSSADDDDVAGDDDDSAEDDCTEASREIFLIGRDSSRLYSFSPNVGLLTLVGALDCSQWAGTPASMGVTRDGVGYVRYAYNEVFEVDLFTADCVPTSYQDTGFDSFGMGYATTAASTTLDTLYVANSDTLGILDTTTWQISTVGSLPSQTELTGTGAGELWAILPLEDPPIVAQLETTSAVFLQTIALPGLPDASVIDTFAFAHWGGSLWIFIRSYGVGNTTDVYQVTPSGTLVLAWPDLGIDVVGAGVSTCAPIVPE